MEEKQRISLGQLELVCIGLSDIRNNKLLVSNIIAIDNMLDYFNGKMKNYFEEKKRVFQKYETVKGSLVVDPITPEFIKELTELQQVEVEIDPQIKPVFAEEDRGRLMMLADSYQNTKNFIDWS